MHKRWYDIDPTVSLAVSLMRNSSDNAQQNCADFIIEKAHKSGLKLQNNVLNDAFNYILRRWYDKDKKVAEAFEYFQMAPFDVQKEIALDVINYLQFAEAGMQF